MYLCKTLKSSPKKFKSLKRRFPPHIFERERDSRERDLRERERLERGKERTLTFWRTNIVSRRWWLVGWCSLARSLARVFFSFFFLFVCSQSTEHKPHETNRDKNARISPPIRKTAKEMFFLLLLLLLFLSLFFSSASWRFERPFLFFYARWRR